MSFLRMLARIGHYQPPNSAPARPTEEQVEALPISLINPDQLSALVTLSDYGRGSNTAVTAPFGASCQSILYAYAEGEKQEPRGVLGFFDISQRKRVQKDILSFTVPFKMYLELEGNVEGSFLQAEPWQKLLERAESGG